MNEKKEAPRLLTVAEVQKILRMGRNTTYAFLGADDCPFRVCRIGRQFRIPAKSFYEWLDGSEQQV